jgi:succinoglycan biosynthesis transport protein ExoP
MLDFKNAVNPPNNASLQLGSSARTAIDFFGTLIRRQARVFFVIVPCALALGLLYLLTTPPSYTAVAKIVIDLRKPTGFQQQQIAGDSIVDAVAVATQAEILTSDNVSLAVINKLKLTEDPDFVRPSPGLFRAALNTLFHWIYGKTDSEPALTESQLEARALGTFEAQRKVSRVPNTYVMEISFRSPDRNKAAQIANAIFAAYTDNQLAAKYESARRASTWLQDRIASLRAESSADAKAVVEFKQRHDIVENSGRMMFEDQRSEVSSQLILARAAAAEAKARYDRIQQVLSQDVTDGSVTDALKSEVIIRLRQQYLDYAAREAIWSQRYGPNHLATISLRNQMVELRRSITDEMKKIAQSYKSEYEIALTRVASIEKSLESAVTESRSTEQAQVQLRELESNAQTSRTMYDNFLQRYMEAAQQQTFPISETQLISPAAPPAHKSQPNTLIVLAISTIGGMLVAFGGAMLLEAYDRVFRTSAQVLDLLRVDCIAVLPLLKLRGSTTHDKEQNIAGLGKRGSTGQTDNLDLLRHVINAPFSIFTEKLRSLKVIADLKGAVAVNSVIGMTSTLANEGKSTIAANFAALIAHSGSRVILVDADLRNPSLSRLFGRASSAGLVDVAAGRAALNDATWIDPANGLTFLSAGAQAWKLVHPDQILASIGVKSVMDKLRDEYDYVIVDFPPLGPVVDTRTTAGFVDSYIYVIEWGRTRIDLVQHALVNAREVYDRLLGVVLNKADIGVIERYERYRYERYMTTYQSADEVEI